MSGANIFKIKILQPSFYQPKQPTTNRVPTPKKKNNLIQLSPQQSQFIMYQGEKNKRPDPLLTHHKYKEIDAIQSYKSATINQTQRVGKKQLHLSTKGYQQSLTIQRPRSVMLKKTRKRSWQTHYARVPLYKHEDIIYPKSYSFNERFQECIAFLKKKSVFVKIVKNRDDLDWEPVSNQYMVKIYGRLDVDGQIYLLMQNVGKSSVRDIIQSFGPYKQSLVKSQIRGLVCGIVHFHNRGIIHNRINPDTIYMGKQGNLLIDLVKGSEKPPSDLEKEKYFHYFPPELLRKQTISEGCDAWALGCLTLQMLTGQIKQSIYHPYNQSCNVSPSFNKSDLKKLREQCRRYSSKNTQPGKGQLSQDLEAQLSNTAKDFISICLKLNEKVRPQLAALLDHDFLRVVY